jgi:hypothetical protein
MGAIRLQGDVGVSLIDRNITVVDYVNGNKTGAKVNCLKK